MGTKRRSVKRAVIAGAISGLIVSFLSDLDPAVAILIGVGCGIGARSNHRRKPDFALTPET